jgi:hypothetical protein
MFETENCAYIIKNPLTEWRGFLNGLQNQEIEVCHTGGMRRKIFFPKKVFPHKNLLI